MALQRSWLTRGEEIIELLRGLKATHLQRSQIEELFQLQRRAAIELMTKVGAVPQRGLPMTVERTSLLAWVESVWRDESWQIARHKQTTAEISRSVEQANAFRLAVQAQGKPVVEFPVSEEWMASTVAALHPDIKIAPGQIIITAPPGDARQATEAVCQRLLELSIAMTADMAGFQSALCGDRPSLKIAV